MNDYTHFERRKLNREYDLFLKENSHGWSSLETFKGFCDQKGWEFIEGKTKIGRVGNGEKNHKFTCHVGHDSEGREYVFSASSGCGSQRWGAGGRSSLYLLDTTRDIECDCKKCNR